MVLKAVFVHEQMKKKLELEVAGHDLHLGGENLGVGDLL